MKNCRYHSIFLFMAMWILNTLLLLPGELYGQNTAKFHVEVSGSGDPVIFIPGLITGGDVWDETVAEFSGSYECHVITMPGFAGVEPQENPPYLETWKENIIQYITEHDLQNVTIIGHSLGGFLGLWIGSEQIEHLKRLVIIDSLPFLAGAMNPNAEPGFSEEYAMQYVNSFSGLAEDQVRGYRRMAAQGMVSDSLHWERLVEWAVSSDLKTEAYAVAELMGTDLRQRIEDITVPVLVLGAFDENPQFPGYTSDTMKKTYQDQYQNVEHLRFEVAEGAKHFIMYDRPDWMVENIKSFFAENSATR